jgi:hypothetical protein
VAARPDPALTPVRHPTPDVPTSLNMGCMPDNARISGKRECTYARWASLAGVLLLSACSVSADGPVAIRTNSIAGRACLLVSETGTLAADPTWGLAFMGKDDAGQAHRYGVVWPHGYSARREQGTILLLDGSGGVVAREGETLELDAERQDPLYPCGDPIVVQGSEP